MLPDVQKSTPLIPLDIDKVCLRGVYRRVCLRDDNGEKFCLDAKVSACIDLPRTQRGIHVSRSIEAIINSFSESLHGDVDKLEDLLKSVVITLLNKHEYAAKASVAIKTVYLHKVVDEDVGVEDYLPVKIFMKTEMSRSGDRVSTLSIEIMGMTVCPCAQEVYAFLEGLRTPDVPSHSQRAKLVLTIKLRGEKTVDIRYLINAGLNAFSAPLYFLLKRRNEYRLVKKAFSTPRFVEDVVREALYNVYKVCNDLLGKDSIVTVEVVSYESIHPYNLYAKASYTIEELRKMFEKA